MNGFQVMYTLALVVLTLPAWHRQRYALGWLWSNLIVTLAICLAMDLAAIDRESATVSMLITDLCAGVGLALKPGISHLIAWGYAITVPIYFANLIWGTAIDTTYGYVYIAAIAQMGVLAIGCGPGFGSGGGGKRGRFASRVFVVLSGRDGAPTGPVLSRDHAGNRVRE